MCATKEINISYNKCCCADCRLWSRLSASFGLVMKWMIVRVSGEKMVVTKYIGL